MAALMNGSVEVESPYEDSTPRKKQKRNKPTLSCEECVERKTKVSGDHGGCSIYIYAYFLLASATGLGLPVWLV